MNNIWDDDGIYVKGIEAFNGFSQNSLLYSETDTYYIEKDTYYTEENLGEKDALIMAKYLSMIMAKYLTIRTQKNHVVIGVVENGTKDVCIGKYEYDDKLKKQHQVLLEKFAEMPEYNEYLTYINEKLDEEIKKS